MVEDAVIAAVHDQVNAGLDVITDGEQTRLDFNLSFYGFINGIESNETETRKFGPPAHDQRGKHNIVGKLLAPNGLDRKSTRLNSSHLPTSRMPSSA